jgi:hypothetical protein
MKDRITNVIDLETAARQFQDAVVSACNENCPTVRQNDRSTSWWNQDLAERRRKVCRLFNVAKKSGNWTDYKITLTDYNKALRQAKENPGEDTVRRLRRLQNVADSRGFFKRMGRVQLVLSSLITENIPNREGDPGRVTLGPLPWFRNNFGTFWRLGRS